MAGKWVENIFEAKGSVDGKNPVRRQISSVQRLASEAELVAECKKRGVILMKTPHQYVIYPKGAFEVLTAG